MKYLNKHPEYWHAAAEGLVLDALKEAFPCKVSRFHFHRVLSQKLNARRELV